MAACRRRVVFASLRGRRPFGPRVVVGALCGHAFGVRVQKVQRVLRVQRVLPASSRRVQRVWYRLTAMDLFKCRLSAAALPAAVKTKQPGFARGNAPLSVLRTTSPKGKHVTGFSGRFAPLRIQFLCHPGGGSLIYAYPCANLSRSLYSAAKISPSGGEAAEGGRRGAFPAGEARLACFPSPARSVVKVLS